MKTKKQLMRKEKLENKVVSQHPSDKRVLRKRKESNMSDVPKTQIKG